jgi:hypothetical protein
VGSAHPTYKSLSTSGQAKGLEGVINIPTPIKSLLNKESLEEESAGAYAGWYNYFSGLRLRPLGAKIPYIP